MKKYLITSREYYTDTPDAFSSILHEQLRKHLPDLALYRDKSNPDYHIQATHFVEICKQFEDIKSFIHQDIDLAVKLGSNGVHLTSKQIDKVADALSMDLEVIVSTHTKEEIIHAQKLGATAVTYSPIFTSPNKGVTKGIKNLKDVVDSVDIKVFALGGIIDDEHIDMLKDTNAYGFASIRYFY